MQQCRHGYAITVAGALQQIRQSPSEKSPSPAGPVSWPRNTRDTEDSTPFTTTLSSTISGNVYPLMSNTKIRPETPPSTSNSKRSAIGPGSAGRKRQVRSRRSGKLCDSVRPSVRMIDGRGRTLRSERRQCRPLR
jgi:hypothetical protein